MALCTVPQRGNNLRLGIKGYVPSMGVRRNHGRGRVSSALCLCQLFVVLFRQILEGNVTWSSFSFEKSAVPCHSYIAIGRNLGSRGCGMWCKRFSVLFFLARPQGVDSFRQRTESVSSCKVPLHCASKRQPSLLVFCFVRWWGRWTVVVGRSTMCHHHGSCLFLLSLQSGAMSCVGCAYWRSSFCS